MFAPTAEELLAAIRRLPLEQRRQVLEQAAQEFQADTPSQPEVRAGATASFLGLFSEEPELADQICDLAYQARSAARMRAAHE